MSHLRFSQFGGVVFTLILFTMSKAGFSQSMPSSDEFKTSSGNVEIRFIGHGSLMFSFNKYIVQIDPVKSSGSYSGLPSPDLILVTHDHGDHLDAKLIDEIKKDGTIMYCNESSVSRVPWAKAIKPGDKKVIGDLTVEAVEAYNIVNGRAPGQPFHPKGVGVGYVLSFGGKRFYIAGDTENTPEMKALKSIDVAFLPMNLPYTMTPIMVADAATAFKPAILYPYHFGDTKTDELIELLKNSGIEVRIRSLR